MIRKTCVLLLSTLLSVYLLSAQKLPSSLLWKISGKNLQKPSYLYGTMHLTDERIFNLGDSLYNAIEHTEGFAIEIDPSEFTPLVINEAKKSMLGAVRLKDMMAADKFKKFGPLLAKKLHKDEDEITTEDILREKNDWIRESYSKGKMQTFLDTYLFDIARREGKWTGGVEDVKDQEGLLDMIDESDIAEVAMNENNENTKKAKDALGEFFIQAYIRNDLNTIDSLSNLGDSLYEDALLVKRNKKMAMRMDSLSHKRSMVFAVGAAHLPGDKGLIALLKEKGYNVSPVFSSKKIKPADYKVAEVPLKWHDVKDEGGMYTVSMPGKPGSMLLYGMMNMQMYFDVFSSTIYMTTALKTPFSQHIADSVLGSVASAYFGTSDYKKGKPVTINNVPGREFLSSKKNYSHGYLLFKDGRMYIAVAMSMKKDSSAATSVNRFLHSFTIATPAPSDGKSFAYTNKEKAYRVQLPAAPQSADDLLALHNDSTLKRDLLIATDPVTGAYFFFGTNEAAPGYYIENDSTTLEGIERSQKDKFSKLNVDTTYINKGIRMLDFRGLMAATPLMMKTHYQFRGNRWYALVAIYDSSKDNSSVDRFFNSFSTLDYVSAEWKSYAPEDTRFSTWAPMNFSNKPTTSSLDAVGHSSNSYSTYDSLRGDTYSVLVENFSKYYWRKNDSAFWDPLIKSYNDEDPSLTKKEISNGDANGYELTTREKGSANVKRVRLLLNGGSLYSLITVQAASEINNANNNKFFDSFRFKNIQPNNSLFLSKAAILLGDIASGDSAVANNAIKYVNAAPFTKDDLQLLHKALLKEYPAGRDEDNDLIKNELGRIIMALKDTSSFTFARNNYNAADDTTRNVLLNIITSFPTRENFNGLKGILLNNTPRIKPVFNFPFNFTDSMQLAAGILPDLLPLLKDTVMADAITIISKKLLDSGLINTELLLPHEPDILQLSQKEYTARTANPDDYHYADYALETLLGKLNTHETNVALQKWSGIKTPYLQQHAVNLLLQNNQVINPLVIQDLAKGKSTRIELYDTLKAYKKENLFPAKYRSQKSFGESLVYSADEDNSPDSITYKAEKVINFKGRKSKFYFYKLAFGEGEDTQNYLGCAGPFPLKDADISLKDARSSIYYDADFDPSNLMAQEDTLINQMLDGFEWQEKK
jgi:uncharacterized protein YbaP (TraB family)